MALENIIGLVSRMTDRERVIKGVLQHCEGSMFDRCGECPYYEIDHEPFVCRDMLLNDLNELLKERKTKWIHREDLDFKDKLGCNHFHGMCENCGFIHDFIDNHTEQYKYCPQCGQVVKWE